MTQHHVNVPYKLSDFEQREGRILRQENHFDKVEMFRHEGVIYTSERNDRVCICRCQRKTCHVLYFV